MATEVSAKSTAALTMADASTAKGFGVDDSGGDGLYFTHLKSVRLHLCNLKITKIG
jgi:hypothetical protein